MAGVLLGEARLGAETVTLLPAAERTAEALVRAIEAGTHTILILPSLSPLTPSS